MISHLVGTKPGKIASMCPRTNSSQQGEHGQADDGVISTCFLSAATGREARTSDSRVRRVEVMEFDPQEPRPHHQEKHLQDKEKEHPFNLLARPCSPCWLES